MPTGYTAKLYEGDEQTFPDFVLSCARAFGALIDMRDAAPDALIPDEILPNTKYHDDSIAKAAADLEAAHGMSEHEADRRAREEFEQAQQSRTEAAVRRGAMAERYEAMLAQVREWEPPTEEHQGLKDFMVQQLEESIRFDTGSVSWPEYPKRTARQWRADRLAKAARDIEYHTKQRDEEIARAADRSKWLRLLRASLDISVIVAGLVE